MTENQMAQQEVLNQVSNNAEMQKEVATLMQEIFNLPLANLVIMFILFFIGGYLLYSSFICGHWSSSG